MSRQGRFGKGGAFKDPDEMSISSDVIRREVSGFATGAAVTEANLIRLERRLHGRAVKRIPDESQSARSPKGARARKARGDQRFRREISEDTVRGMDFRLLPRFRAVKGAF